METKVSPVDDLRLSLELLPALAGAIRKLRMQRMMPQAPAPVPAAPEPPKYQQNKWELSPSG